MANIKKNKSTNSGQVLGATVTLMLLERVENAITTLGNSLAISHKIKYILYKNDSGTLHLGVFSRVIKIFDCSKTSA